MFFLLSFLFLLVGMVILILFVSSQKRKYIEAATIKNPIGTPTYEKVEKICNHENDVQENKTVKFNDEKEERTEAKSEINSPISETEEIHTNEMMRIAFLAKLKDFLAETYNRNVKYYYVLPDQDVVSAQSIWIHLVFKNEMENNVLIYKVPSIQGFAFSLSNPIDTNTLPLTDDESISESEKIPDDYVKEWVEKYLSAFEEKKLSAEEKEVNFFVFEGNFPEDDDKTKAIIDAMELKGFFLSEIDDGIMVTW